MGKLWSSDCQKKSGSVQGELVLSELVLLAPWKSFELYNCFKSLLWTSTRNKSFKGIWNDVHRNWSLWPRRTNFLHLFEPSLPPQVSPPFLHCGLWESVAPAWQNDEHADDEFNLEAFLCRCYGSKISTQTKAGTKQIHCDNRTFYQFSENWGFASIPLRRQMR